MVRISSKKIANIFISISRHVLDYRLGAFLVLCFVLGGTSQDIVLPKLPIYLCSILLIACSILKLESSSLFWKLKTPFILLLLFVGISSLYLVPLPPSIWSTLPGREFITHGFEVLDMALPWMPMSVAPEATFFSLFDFLPPFAVLFIIGVLASKREVKIAIWSILLFAVFTVIFGTVQLVGISEDLYFYKFTNKSSAVGFFSNANHQASFLLMVLPFSIFGFEQVRRGATDNASMNAILILVVLFISMLVGILLTGSIAGYFLMVPVILGVLVFCLPRRTVSKKHIGIFIALFFMALLADFLFLGNYLGELIAELNGEGHESRQVMFSTTYGAIKDFFPFGSGLGSFSTVYQLYEEAGNRTIPHAHADFLEMALEYGLVGMLLILGFLWWWGKKIVVALNSNHQAMLLAKCSSVSTISVLIHSGMDYPLRTIGLSSFFMLCLCLMVVKSDAFD